MASIFPNIKPNGRNIKDTVDLYYMMVSSIAGLCAKLDNDATVPLETYLANCYTAIFDTIIEDSRGNRTGLGGGHIINTNSLTVKAEIELMYQLFNSIETLTEQLDADTLTDSDYEELVYEASYLVNVTIGTGSTLGNGTVYYFGPTSMPQEREMVDLLYNMVDAWETLCEKLDADATPTDVNYEALWFTATFLLRIENSKGSTVGNDSIT